MSSIVDFISDLTFEDIPEPARRTARLCLLDAVGCLIAGMKDPAIAALAEAVSKAHPGSSKIPLSPHASTRAWASFINTHACSYFDIDDGHRKAQGHPGGVIVPLSLLFASENGASGKALLSAIVAGYETAVRSALIMRRLGGPRKGSGAWSITGGVAAAGKLSGVSKAVLENALGLAEYYAPQAPQDRSLARPSSMKEGMAWASHTAVTSLWLAETGLDAMAPFLLDAPECGDLGSNWEIASVYFKMYACCRFSHPVLDGLTSLISTHGITPDEIKTIVVDSFAKALLLDDPAPLNSVAAMYSIPYAVGCKLVKGAVEPDGIAADALEDPQILKIARKVAIRENAEFTKLFPEKCLAKIALHLHNGSVIESDVLSAKGDPDTPYTADELRLKFMRLAQSLPDMKAARAYDVVMNMENESPKELWDILSC